MLKATKKIINFFIEVKIILLFSIVVTKKFKNKVYP